MAHFPRETLPADWAAVLPPETVSMAARLMDEIDGLRRAAERGDGPAVFPPAGQVFRALSLTPPASVRAVILGQDPYPTPGHASGLCFSVKSDVSPLPASLRNIFREYAADLGCPAPESGDLSAWAERGVLLLNAVLTVPAGKPNGHKKLGWQAVTNAVLRACLRLPEPAVFLLWGREAQTVFDRAAAAVAAEGGEHGEPVPVREPLTVRSSHPSPLGAAKPCGDSPPFLGSRPFSAANRLLGCRAVDWRLM